MITTNSIVTVVKKLRPGKVTNYSANKLSLFIKCNSTQKRVQCASVTNATLTSAGELVFSVDLWQDGSYSFYITSEDNDNLEMNNVALTKLATGYIKKITNQVILFV